MSVLLHQLISHQAQQQPHARALGFNKQWLTYAELQQQVQQLATSLLTRGLQTQQRVAIYLPKCIENVVGMFATSAARAIFVPINPVLKAPQVGHILTDCQASILITSYQRWQQLAGSLPRSVQQVVITDLPEQQHQPGIISWQDLLQQAGSVTRTNGMETDIAAIFYTSGSTGKAKGVVLSQRNMLLGAQSVAQYLESKSSDRLLAVQPLSFDYGFSQLSIAFSSGASCYLMEYLFPQDIIKTIAEQQITSLALVPPLWIKLAELTWPDNATQHLRYFTNTGGAMPQATLGKLRNIFPNAKPYLMYGLTEAFRSCYLPPDDVDRKPGSFGKAIPNAEIWVLDQQGRPCAANEPGELVHAGPLVSMGYWNNPQKTSDRFKPLPFAHSEVSQQHMAVWSGDIVTRDEEGFLYFIGRNDDMIKTSGYRLSPLELEEHIYQSGMVSEAIALGLPHPQLGQAIMLLLVPHAGREVCLQSIKHICQQQLANYMQPHAICIEDNFARNPNGKIDRNRLTAKYQHYFSE